MSILFLICDQTGEGEGEGKWQRTGDIGELDEDGFVYITDRKKDMIVTGGNNVYPRQIEEIIYQNKEIEEACIVGISEKLWGETVHLVAVLHSRSTTTKDEIIKWARSHLHTIEYDLLNLSTNFRRIIMEKYSEKRLEMNPEIRREKLFELSK